ncbi:homocitrate synthase NifV [Amycolatopsis australiensis]|uniref:Homocitrate synthase NifV n=2 Tax=Amycolatopsis australiensis TaxID=546364 RepID=A0A1K1SQ88_9PSEU|nr:homocitrate synthase NifV [Amycolatopsis australiensis]
MAGVEFTPEDATRISSLLVGVGVDLVEVGIISAAGSPDAELISAVHGEVGPERSLSLVMVRDRKQVAGALEEAGRLGCRSIMLSIPTSARHAELKLASSSLGYLKTLAKSAITQAKDRGFHVTFSGEDAARTDVERLNDYVAAGFAAGADRFRLAETVATLRPQDCAELVAGLVAIDGAEIEIHSHNMLGMAVANSFAAFDAGAAWISTTVGGIGERGGNSPLAEVLCTLRAAYGDTGRDLSQLTELTREAIRRGGFGSAFMSGPTTPHAYAYELLGQLIHPEAYETTPAEVVGNERSLRVRSRLSPALVEFALEGHDPAVDANRFCSWLAAHQEQRGNPLLDRDSIRGLAREYAALNLVTGGR